MKPGQPETISKTPPSWPFEELKKDAVKKVKKV